jgi:FKBP-type peptidyl-prolyl cis-trans isomerase
MRRLLPVPLLCLALLAACGDDSGSDGGAGTTAPAATSGTTPSTDTGSAAATCQSETSADAPTPDKPEVQIPTTLPTELVVTDLVEGTGEAAKAGDTVKVHYVGVRSADGTEFDNSYDKGEAFPVTLGQGGVIEGWDEGLVGIKVGGRRQLDIPAELAYGDTPPPGGGVIQPGDALTFVIDAVSITPGVDIPPVNPADKPTVSVPTNSAATEITVTDLVEGTGAEATLCQTAYVHVTFYRGDTGAEMQSSWTLGQPAVIPLDDRTVPAFVQGIEGMKVGGRRLLVVPAAEIFDSAGNESFGLPANTDLVAVLDLVQVGPLL